MSTSVKGLCSYVYFFLTYFLHTTKRNKRFIKIPNQGSLIPKFLI